MQTSSPPDTRPPQETQDGSQHSRLAGSRKALEQPATGLGIQLTQSPTQYASGKNSGSLSTNSADPAPRLTREAVFRANLASHELNATTDILGPHHGSESITGGLHLHTEDLPSIYSPPIVEHGVEGEDYLQRTISNNSLPRRALSHRNMLYSSIRSVSPATSIVSSPQLAAMGDMTPLPSPTIGSGKDPWRIALRTRSRASSAASNRESSTSSATTATTVQSSPPRRKAYHGLRQPIGDAVVLPAPMLDKRDLQSNEKSRSLSEYVPAALTVPKPRPVAVSGAGQPSDTTQASALHREEYLAEQRGVSTTDMKADVPHQVNETGDFTADEQIEPAPKRQKTEVYTAVSIASGHTRKYREIRFLGQGTFSKVYLAVQQVESADDGVDYTVEGTSIEGVKARSKRFVAVKVIGHAPAGGADEERIGISLKREVELLRSINHPSLVHLRAFGAEESRALLVLNFCPGGDLFELASTKLYLLVPTLVQRIFTELVSAVLYLHQNQIVHRDIKLENVLLNVPSVVLPEVLDWRFHDRAVVTLTDLGLGRRIPEPPESPLLTTRCGSDDYAAPEIHLGQPYDGRQTDAWALGVTLYALMEGRLPFDPLPGARGDPAELRKRTPHRIARCEWAWVKFGDEDGDWDKEKGKEFIGANVIVDALFKRSSRRKDLGSIAQMEWVKRGIQVPGGLARDEEAV